jgi:hypothetical protein
MSKSKRCPDCDRDGEVWRPNGGYMTCPRCEGTKRIEREEQPVSDETMYQWLMVSAAVMAVLCGLGAVGLVILCAVTFSFGVLVCALLLAGGAIGSGYFTTYFSAKATTPKVFNNQDEREVLTNKQRKILKAARGEVVMEKAMVEVEHERENIVHNQMKAIQDPNRPPHPTQWTTDPNVRELRSRTDKEERY